MFKKKSTDSPRARVFESRDHLDTQTSLKKFDELFTKYKNKNKFFWGGEAIELRQFWRF